MKPDREFIQVDGTPQGQAGDVLTLAEEGEEYVVVEVEQTTTYHLRKPTVAELRDAPNRILVEDDQIRLVYRKRDVRSRGLTMALREMEKQKKIGDNRRLRRERRQQDGT